MVSRGQALNGDLGLNTDATGPDEEEGWRSSNQRDEFVSSREVKSKSGASSDRDR